jgi:hypothetical protein
MLTSSHDEHGPRPGQKINLYVVSAQRKSVVGELAKQAAVRQIG